MRPNFFQKPMQSWPDLISYGRQVRLPRLGLELFLYDAGEKEAPPIFLIHGLGDEADTWRHLIPGLIPQYRVFALDLPGFGRSQLPSQAITIPFFQSVVLELMELLGVPHAVLVGHSMGGVIAHALALDYPHRVDRLYLLAGSLVAQVTRLNWMTLLFLVPGLGERQYNRLRRDPQAAYRSLKVYYRNLEALPEPDRQFLFQRVNERVWSDTQRQAFLSALRSLARWAPAQQRNLPERLAKLRVPTWVLWGEADGVNVITNGHALVRLQSSARLVVIPDAGHNFHQENPSAVLRIILEAESPR